MSNKYILNLHYDDVESSPNPRQIHIESTSNSHRILLSIRRRNPRRNRHRNLIESTSNSRRIDVESSSNRHRILVDSTSKSSSKSSSNRHRTLIEPLSIRRGFDVESSSNRRRILVESTSNISTSIRHRIDQVKIVDSTSIRDIESTSNRHRIDIVSTSNRHRLYLLKFCKEYYCIRSNICNHRNIRSCHYCAVFLYGIIPRVQS